MQATGTSQTNPSRNGDKTMSYAEFKTAYTNAFVESMKYKPSEIGSRIWTDRMADLYDAYPEWAEMVEEEAE